MIARRTFLAGVVSVVYLPLTRAGAPPPLPDGTPCRIVWVWPASETLNGAQASAARTDLLSALQFWNMLAPFPGLYIAREESFRLDDPYATHQWLYALDAPPIITVAVVINQASQRYVDLGGGVAAPAYCWPGHGTLYASIRSDLTHNYNGVGLGPMVAHELGHALYQLKDGDPAWPIMGPIDLAWAAWQLAHPC